MKRWRPELPATYAARTHASPYWVVRHAHERRFRAAGNLVARAAPSELLDYGCGDGHFLIGLLNADLLPPTTKLSAFEPMPEMAATLRANLATGGFDNRVDVCTEMDQLSDKQYDYVTCFEVLEHLPVTSRFVFYDFLRRMLAPEGLALIGVPIEIGPTLLVKEFGRRILKRDPPDYDALGLLRIVAGRPVFDAQRFDPTVGSFIIRHKGFDYRILWQELERHFTVAEEFTTPLPHLPAWLGNQELFLTLRHME